jgi:NAD(P)H dehydrogenase (quinone)
MSDVNVLVVFYSRHGTTEKLALAAGLGAIQARANIRLRRLADLADRQTIEANASWLENLDRMNRDYVAPRPADPLWADVIVLATPRESSVEIERYCASLEPGDTISGKIAAPLAPGDDDAVLRPIHAAAACAGLIVAPPSKGAGDALAAARAFGQRVTRMARSLKQGQQSTL